MHRVIFTKHGIYELEPDACGVPIEEYFKNANFGAWPEPFRGAKVYETPYGPVIAVRERPKPR
jgi:hypothetical protein